MAKMKMSAELKASLAASAKKRKATKPIVRTYWINKPSFTAKDLFDVPVEEPTVIDADSCGTHGLRPTWHGRA